MKIGASGGASSFADEVSDLGSTSLSKENDPELTAAIESAKKAIADAPKLSDEEERAMIKAIRLRPFNSELKGELIIAEKENDWDKILELFQNYKDVQNLLNYQVYIWTAIEVGNFKFICKFIEKNPEFKDYFARETLNFTIRNKDAEYFDFFLKTIKFFEDLGFNINELAIKKDNYGKTLLTKAAGERIGEEGEPNREEFYEYFLKRFRDQNFKLDTETVDSVLRIVAGSARNETDPRAAKIIKFLKDDAESIHYFKEKKEDCLKYMEESSKILLAARMHTQHEDNEGTTALMGGISEEHEGTELS